MCLKAMITAEVIACNVFEDLLSSFSSLYCALANYFCALNFFFIFIGNKLTYMVHSFLITYIQTIKRGICKAQRKINFDLEEKNVEMSLCFF